MNKFAWGGANDPSVNIDYHHKRTLMVVRARLNYARLARALVAEGKNEKAVEVLDRCMEVLPLSNVPYDPYVNDLIKGYFSAGEYDKALTMVKDLCTHYYANLNYYLKQQAYIVSSAEYEIGTAFEYVRRAGEDCITYGQKETGMEINKKLQEYYTQYTGFIQPADR
jgi:pentatricopeptide repeat protein